MDRFSKTTEIDLSEIAPIEDGTPQKSRIGKIIALVVCLIIAVFIWLFVMEIDTDIHDKTIKNVPVYATVTEAVPSETASITVKGIRKCIIDFKAEDFKITRARGGYSIVLVGEKSELYNLENESTDDEIIVAVSLK